MLHNRHICASQKALAERFREILFHCHCQECNGFIAMVLHDFDCSCRGCGDAFEQGQRGAQEGKDSRRCVYPSLWPCIEDLKFDHCRVGTWWHFCARNGIILVCVAIVENWDLHADIVIVGIGLAGYSAAIEAFDRGSSIDILILEKAPEHHRRGNGRVAGQSFFVPKSREKLKCHMQALCASNPLPEGYLNDWVSDMMGLEYVYPFGTPYNTGDGLQILMKVHGHYLDTLHSAVTPIHMIFDEETRLGGALTFGSFTWSAVIGEYDCSENADQETRSGIIKTADSIPELAVLMGRPPDSVKATVDRFNRMCALGHDEDHGKDPDSMAPITPPSIHWK